MYTVDASVWISAASPRERDYPASRGLIDRLGVLQPRIVRRELAYVEVAATIGRMHGDPALGMAMADAIERLPFVQWLPLDRALRTSSAAIATNNRLRGADAVYAAVALQERCVLVSLDGEHLTRLTGVVPTLTPAAAAALAGLAPSL